MKSEADDLRAEQRAEMNRLSLGERLALVFRLGEDGIERFRLANGLDRETAIRILEGRRQASRTPSNCMSEIIG
ncbi:MAG TPA: hypothetical protein VN851_06055 [Thermoanaerobaculia bacterium]|nr:hypothetical protein [Thermoanaerobaculia bacterium]